MIDFTLSASTPIHSVGIIGGGQLAWMMADAAKKLGVQLHIQTPSKSDPAVAIATDTVLAPIADATATKELAARSQVITFENEFIDLPALSHLAEQGTCFRPGLQALRPILDKCEQRTYLRQLGLPTPQFVALDPDQPQLGKLGFPLVVKTRRHGYDGQGTFVCPAQQSLQQVLQSRRGVPLLLEEFVPFTQELAMVAARSVDGAVQCYPLVETQQTDQVCRRVFAPAAVSPTVAQQAEVIAHTLLNGLRAVGVFGIELFLTAEGALLVNELAPRVHNSGHFTLDACRTSQFEQHLRAVCGLPLGDVEMTCAMAVMVNLLGFEVAQSDYISKREQLAALPNAHVYWYGKTDSRPGRKLGHVTVLLDGDSHQALRAPAEAIAHQIEGIWYAS